VGKTLGQIRVSTRPLAKTAFLHLALFFGAAAVAILPQIPLPTPTGGDPGNYLALARSFPVGLDYYPTVPFILSLFVRGAENSLAFLWLRVLSGLFYGALAYAVYLLVASASEKRVAVASYLIMLFSPLQLESLAWGAYPQVLALALSVSGMAFVVRWIRDSALKYASLAGVLFGFAILTHPVSALFGLVASVAYVLLSRTRVQEAAKGLGLLALALSPFAVGMWYFLLQLNFIPSTPIGFDAGVVYWVFIRIFGGLDTASLVSMAIILVLLSMAIIFERNRTLLRISLSLLAGGLALLYVIPAQFPDRLAYYLFFALPVVAGLGFRSLTPHQPRLGRRLLSKSYRWVAVAGVIVLYAGAGFWHYDQSLHFNSDLSQDDLAAFNWLNQNAPPGSGVIVTSTSAGVLGWWLEGLTSLKAYIATDTYWYLLRDQRSQSITAWLALAGSDVVDGGRIKFVENFPRGGQSTPAIFLYDGENFYEVLNFNDALVTIGFSPPENNTIVFREAPYYAPIKAEPVWGITPSSVQWMASFAWNRAWGSTNGNVTDGGPLDVVYHFHFNDSLPRFASVRFVAPESITFRNATWKPPTLFLTTQRTTGEVNHVDVNVTTNTGQVSPQIIPVDEWGLSEVRFDFGVSPALTDLDMRFTVTVEGYAPESLSYYSTTTLLSHENIRFVLVTGDEQNAIARLNSDPRFTLRERFGSVLVYEYLGERSP
jgi:hypothetical protein